MNEIDEIELRLKKAVEWFDKHEQDGSESWDKAFELFRSLLKRRSELYVEEEYEQKNMFSY